MPKYSVKTSNSKDRWGKRSNTKVKLQEFQSITELVNYLDKTPYNHVFDDNQSKSSESSDSSFSGTSSFQEALGLMSSGWSTLAKKLNKKVPVVSKSAQTVKQRQNYDVVGFQASVPRYVMGLPTNMINRKPVVQKQKIIVINKDLSYSARTNSSEIEAEGVKALQIIQALEHKGYRVKLNMCFASNSGNETIALRVTVKKPEERLSLNKIAFPIAHPSMLRRIGFKWVETFPFMESNGYRWGYGTPSTNSIKDVLDEKEIFLPNFIPDVDKFIEEQGF